MTKYHAVTLEVTITKTMLIYGANDEDQAAEMAIEDLMITPEDVKLEDIEVVGSTEEWDD